MYEPRLYRQLPVNNRFFRHEIGYLETDLWIALAPEIPEYELHTFVIEQIKSLRSDIASYCITYPEFSTSFQPLPDDDTTVPVIQKMLKASEKAQVGPMAAVAGAFAEEIAKRIQKQFNINEIIIENGGDIYLDIRKPVVMGLYAGKSPLSNKIGIEIGPDHSPLGICTSSGKVGHSTSFGKADAVMIACQDTALADAYATAFGNLIQTENDINPIIARTKEIPEIISVVIIVDDKIGVRGNLNLKILNN